MKSWLDVEGRFKELRDPLRHVRLDIQWGAAGEHFSLSGAAPSTRQFETLASVAGRLLERSLKPDAEPGTTLLAESDPRLHWYRALKDLSGEFQHDYPAHTLDERGNVSGNIFHGSLHGIAEASANLCLKIYANYPLRDDRSFRQRLYDDYGKEIVIGTMIAITTAIVTVIIGYFFGG